MSTYAYVPTLQWHTNGPGFAITTSSGTVDIPDGMTRDQVYQQIRSNMIESAGIHGDPNTMFWSLEPNELA